MTHHNLKAFLICFKVVMKTENGKRKTENGEFKVKLSIKNEKQKNKEFKVGLIQ